MEGWEELKVEIKRKSITYAIEKSKQRKIQEEICNDILTQNVEKAVKDKARERLDEIKHFRNKGIKVRTENDNLNKIYDHGKELNRKEEKKKEILKQL